MHATLCNQVYINASLSVSMPVFQYKCNSFNNMQSARMKGTPVLMQLVILLALILDTEGENILSNGHLILQRGKRAAVSDTGKSALTQADRDLFLSEHNNYRSGVNPTASDMTKMEWSSSLETQAQNWASGCAYGHSAADTYGENIWAASNGYDIQGSVADWYNEVSDYTYSTLSCTAECTHYTQVVWANTNNLGCGIKYCANLFSNGGYFIVCQYSPSGNFAGQAPYQSGTSCANCASGTTCESNLCATATDTGDDGGDGSDGGPSVSGVPSTASSHLLLFSMFLLLCLCKFIK